MTGAAVFLQDPVDNCIQQTGHVADCFGGADNDARMDAGSVRNQVRQIASQVPAARHEQGHQGDPLDASIGEQAHCSRQIRLHVLQEGQLGRDAGRSGVHDFAKAHKRLGPLRVARAVGEEDHTVPALTVHPGQRPVLPKPPAPRALTSKSSTTLSLTCTTGTTTNCARRSMGSIVNGAFPRFHVETNSCPW